MTEAARPHCNIWPKRLRHAQVVPRTSLFVAVYRILLFIAVVTFRARGLFGKKSVLDT